VTEKTGAAVTDPQPELVYQVVFLLRQHSQQCGGTPCMQSVSSICGAKKRDSLSSVGNFLKDTTIERRNLLLKLTSITSLNSDTKIHGI